MLSKPLSQYGYPTLNHSLHARKNHSIVSYHINVTACNVIHHRTIAEDFALQTDSRLTGSSDEWTHFTPVVNIPL